MSDYNQWAQMAGMVALGAQQAQYGGHRTFVDFGTPDTGLEGWIKHFLASGQPLAEAITSANTVLDAKAAREKVDADRRRAEMKAAEVAQADRMAERAEIRKNLMGEIASRFEQAPKRRWISILEAIK